MKMTLRQSNSQIPVLFVLIGWALRYDGTESLIGSQEYLQAHPADNEEAKAFIRGSDGYYYCGIGRGNLYERVLDIVFVARDPTQRYKIIGFYRGAKVWEEEGGEWVTVHTKRAHLISVQTRPVVANWKGQGMRRWARRILSKGKVHPDLLQLYRSTVKSHSPPTSEPVDIDPELNAFEGKQRRLFVKHRRREAKLRAAKIRQKLRDGNGHLQCEVPGCAFDFFIAYGEIGRRYAVVHHTKPLASLKTEGAATSLGDLAIVCANCHAMIHRDGQCRSLEAVKPRVLFSNSRRQANAEHATLNRKFERRG